VLTFALASPAVDFRVPENFYHDVNSVAGLLKHFFRDLPDPLLTNERYQQFIDAARACPLRPSALMGLTSCQVSRITLVDETRYTRTSIAFRTHTMLHYEH
jgi:RhoGAP domain